LSASQQDQGNITEHPHIDNPKKHQLSTI
jgi:hypothetical protein